MSPTSFQTAPPRVMKFKWMEVDSNHRSNLQQIYSLSPLATRESIHLCKTLSSYYLYNIKLFTWGLQGSNL